MGKLTMCGWSEIVFGQAQQTIAMLSRMGALKTAGNWCMDAEVTYSYPCKTP